MGGWNHYKFVNIVLHPCLNSYLWRSTICTKTLFIWEAIWGIYEWNVLIAGRPKQLWGSWFIRCDTFVCYTCPSNYLHSLPPYWSLQIVRPVATLSSQASLSNLQICETLFASQTDGFPYLPTTTNVRARTQLCIDVCIFIYQKSVTHYLSLCSLFFHW